MRLVQALVTVVLTVALAGCSGSDESGRDSRSTDAAVVAPLGDGSSDALTAEGPGRTDLQADGCGATTCPVNTCVAAGGICASNSFGIGCPPGYSSNPTGDCPTGKTCCVKADVDLGTAAEASTSRDGAVNPDLPPEPTCEQNGGKCQVATPVGLACPPSYQPGGVGTCSVGGTDSCCKPL